VPDQARAIDEMVALLSAEAEAMLTGGVSDDDAIADLELRLALFSWDVLEDPEASARHLELAERHPMAARLLFEHALSASSPDQLEAAQSALDRMPVQSTADKRRRAALCCEVAEAWLYRFGDAGHAAEVAASGLELEPGAATAEELRYLRYLALAVNEDWGELATAVTEAAIGGSKKSGGAPLDLDRLREALHLSFDRLDDASAALELLGRVDKHLVSSLQNATGTDLVGFGVTGLGVEITRASGEGAEAEHAEMLRRRATMCERDEGSAREAAATRYLLADALRAAGDVDGATGELDTLAGAEDGSWGARLARLQRWLLAADSGDWASVVESLRQLAVRAGGGSYSIAYVRRAAEILDGRVGDTDRALDLWRKTLSKLHGDEQAQRAAERLLVQRALSGDASDLVTHLQAQARAQSEARSFALRRAAAVAEARAGDIALATRLRTASLDTEEEGSDAGGTAELARLYRRARDRGKLADAYRSLAAKLGNDARAVAAVLCAAGAVELSRGRPTEAAEMLTQAVAKAPKDPAARLALAAVQRRAGQWKELVATLETLADLMVEPSARAQMLREAGKVWSEQLKDSKRARSMMEKALEIDPDDADTLHAVAALYDEAGQWDKAVELRSRAVDAFQDQAKQVMLLMEIGKVEGARRDDETAALAAYERAFAIDNTSVEALRAQADIHRARGDERELLRVLRIELQMGPDDERRRMLQLELARLIATQEGDTEGVVNAYLDALAVKPDDELALTGLETLARQERRWDALAEAFRQAPRTVHNLRVLCDALSELGEWQEYVEARNAELELIEDKGEKAKAAIHLAGVFEERLADVDRAIASYDRALELEPSSPEAQQSLARLLEENSRWAELAGAFERELTTVPAADRDRQMGLLLRLGALRREKLSKEAEAALAYESVLELAPQHIPALEALEAIYTQLDREKDLLRVLEARAEATEDTLERSELYIRVAEVKGGRNDAEGSISAYKESFKSNPSNRDTFTAMEKLCYKHERWSDVMELYDTAIALIEEGTSRAYRLGDLYARRGQVQLQYLHELGEAAASYLRVIELDPDNDTAVKFLESIFSQQGDWSGLIEAYEKRAKLTRDDERRLDTLRRAARVAGAKLKDPAEAARIYELILDADPTDREGLDSLERFHERNEDWNKLVEVLKKRLSSAPAGDAATALLKRIAQICEEGLRDEQRAIEHYLRILEIAPGNKEALEALGRIYESTEQWAEFIDVTRRQIRITTERNVKALLYFKCGSVMEAKFGKEEDAIRYYDAAIKTSPSCLPAVHGLRDLYRRRKDWPRVIQTLELEVKLWQDDKERAGVFAQIGRIYSSQLDQPERAMHYYESALAVDPECLPANKALFEHYFERGEWERAQPLAVALAQKAMREGDPSQRSEFYRKRGIVARMTGDMRGAAESLVISLEIKPTNVEALDALGELAKVEPYCYDFPATYRELDKIYRKRDDAAAQVARVRVAEAVMTEREGDLDAAEKLYAQAYELAPGDFAIMSALVDLHCNMRRWTHATDAIVRFIEGASTPPDDVRARALMRQAEIHADCEMDSHRAVAVLKEIIRLEPQNEEAPYRMAQELFLLGRYGEARSAIERAIELAAAPGREIRPEVLARYYYYLGRIVEAAGDTRVATSQYRRAAEYDPGYAPPVLALAKRAAEGGDQRQSETLLINAAHAAMESGGAQAAVPLQRGLARILLGSGDRPAAIEAYRGILAVEPDGAADRVALAEIYATDDLVKAVGELRKVLDRDIRHAPTYHLLASLYARSGEQDRAARVWAAMDLLGFADDSDRSAAASARATQQHIPLRRALDEEMREQLLLTAGTSDPVAQLFGAVAEHVTALFPQPPMGENLLPIQTIEDPALKVALADVNRLFGIEPEVYIGENVPAGMVALAYPRKIVVIDREMLTELDTARRFLLGYAFDGIRAGYALLYHLSKRQRSELASLLGSLLQSEADRAGPTNDFVRSLPKRASKIVDSLAGKSRDADPEEWVDEMFATAKRAGLFGCDDFYAATRMIARMNGERLPGGDGGVTGLAAVLGGHDLVRFYLSDEYHRLRNILATPLPVAAV